MNISNISLQLIKDLLSMKAPTQTQGAADAGAASKVAQTQAARPGGIQALRPGDVVQAKVVAVSNESIVLSIGGTRIPASSELALSPGQMVALVVAELTPERVVLKQLSDKSRGPLPTKYTQEELVRYLLKGSELKAADVQAMVELLKGSSIEAGKEFQQLKHIMSVMLAEDGQAGALPDLKELPGLKELAAKVDGLIIHAEDKQQILSRLKAMVEAVTHDAKLVEVLGGADLKLEDFKESLLRARVLVGESQSLSPQLKAQVKEAADRVIVLFNAVEALNLPVESTAKSFYYLPIPIQVGEHATTAEIRIYSKGWGSGAANQGSSAFTIGFALDMPSLGKTRALIETADKFINFSIGVENASALDGADTLFDDLKLSLERLGYQVGRISAVKIDELKDEAGTEEQSLIEEKLGVSHEGIDVKA